MLERIRWTCLSSHCSHLALQNVLLALLPASTTLHLQEGFSLPNRWLQTQLAVTSLFFPRLSKQPSASLCTSHPPKRPFSYCCASSVSWAVTSYLLMTQNWPRAPPKGSIQEAGTPLLPSHPAPVRHHLLFFYTLLKLPQFEQGNRMSFSHLSQAFFPALK